MNPQSIKSLQVALACQVAQKNALMSAVKLACVCRWAETSAAEVGLTHPTAAFHMFQHPDGFGWFRCFTPDIFLILQKIITFL